VKRKRRKTTPAEVSANFTRGFVATALLTAIQGRRGGLAGPSGAKVLRYAMQGGTALAAGAATATALQRRNYTDALVAVAGGVASMVAIEYLFNPLGQEEDKETSIG
jgi:hypothetical protein